MIKRKGQVKYRLDQNTIGKVMFKSEIIGQNSINKRRESQKQYESKLKKEDKLIEKRQFSEEQETRKRRGKTLKFHITCTAYNNVYS